MKRVAVTMAACAAFALAIAIAPCSANADPIALRAPGTDRASAGTVFGTPESSAAVAFSPTVAAALMRSPSGPASRPALATC